MGSHGLTKHRAWLMALALLRCNFQYGDLIRWLGGEYTNDNRDWSTTMAMMEGIRHLPILPGFPNRRLRPRLSHLPTRHTYLRTSRLHLRRRYPPKHLR